VLRAFLKTFQEIVYVERFSASNGVLQRIDPQVKLFSTMAFILSAVAVRTVTPLTILFAAIVALCIASKIPVKFFFLRTTIFIPIFAAVIALPLPFITPGVPLAKFEYGGLVAGVTMEGIHRATQFVLKVWVSVASLILLVLTTRFSRLVHAMEKFKLPGVLVTMTAVTYRFIFLFVNESYRMALAKESRTVERERWREALRSLANMIATLFIRAYERGERVYLSMIARGYAGKVRLLGDMECATRDWVFASVSMLICLMALSTEYLHLGGW
jgi:cobalt/nickel transport system permease protein